ncbi:MAG: putative diacylglycerol O-acyltransferase [Caulobacter sp.]|nr:putative diacylglycerol O-acyltransferase [Caulobacter sp.]
MEHLSSLDASFLHLETPETPMHVGSFLLLELPKDYDGDFFEAVRAMIINRSHISRVFRHKLAQMPFDLGDPVWIEDDDVDFDFHIRRVILPKPGTMEQLETLVARLHSTLMDRSRPLWELYVIEGLESGNVAAYFRGHHAAVDGKAGAELAQALYDTSPVPRVFDAPEPVTNQRSYTAFTLPLADVKAAAKTRGGTLNDGVLALCSSALRGFLKERGALPDKAMVAGVPVSLREAGDASANNQVSAVTISLASDIADPAARLDAIIASGEQSKKILRAGKKLITTDFPVLGSPWLMSGLATFYGRSGLADRAPPTANVAVSNVPGPPVPLYLCGARLLTFYPVSLPYHGIALNVTVQSYAGQLDFGLTACRRALSHAEVRSLAKHFQEAFEELKDLIPLDPKAEKPAPQAARTRAKAKA